MPGYVLALGILAGLALAIMRPFSLLLLIVFLLPLEWFAAFGKMTLNRFLIPFLIVGWVTERSRYAQGLKVKRSVVIMTLWLLWGFVSIFWSTGRQWAQLFRSFGNALVLFGAIAHLVDTRERFQWVVRAFMAGATVFVLIYFRTGVMIKGTFFVPGAGTGGVSEYGNMIGAVFICALVLTVFTRGKSRLVAGLTIPPIGYLVLAAGLKRSIVAAVGVMVAIGLSSQRKGRHVLVLTAILTVIVTWLWDDILELIPSGTRYRYDVEYVSQNPAGTRMSIWSVAIETWADSPFVGIGFGDFGAYSRLRPELGYLARSIHNMPLQMLTELGIVGLFLWAWAWIRVVKAGVRGYQGSSAVGQSVFGAIPLGLSVFLFLNGMVNPILSWRVLWFAWGLSVAAEDVFRVPATVPRYAAGIRTPFRVRTLPFPYAGRFRSSKEMDSLSRSGQARRTP
jgi:O-antigen ligase